MIICRITRIHWQNIWALKNFSKFLISKIKISKCIVSHLSKYLVFCYKGSHLQNKHLLVLWSRYKSKLCEHALLLYEIASCPWCVWSSPSKSHESSFKWGRLYSKKWINISKLFLLRHMLKLHLCFTYFIDVHTVFASESAS